LAAASFLFVRGGRVIGRSIEWAKPHYAGSFIVQKSFLVSSVVFVALLATSWVVLRRATRPWGATKAHPAKTQTFDPHDLNGIWLLINRRQLSISDHRPPLTPWGQAKFSKTRSSWTNAALGVRAFPEKQWNDPLFQCDPAGYPRTMQQIFGEIMRFVATPNEMLEFFEWDHTWRDVWTDGRRLHDDPEPRYYGYSVGSWDGDTFVVDSNGFSDRTWLDVWGDVHSDQMRLKETFRRVNRDHLEWTITVDDPKTYTQSWGPSDKRVFQWVPKSPRSEYEELREDFCVWSDAAGFFKRVDTVGLGDAPARGNKSR
jgi:hypothetical protein